MEILSDSNNIDDHLQTVDDEAYEPTYAEAFPPLPPHDEAEQLDEPAEVITHIPNQWHNNNNQIKMAVKSSVVTQVFNVPMEERKYREMSSEIQFGDRGKAQAGICNDIMARTGVAIEMSIAKDQSLAVIVTGKQDAVLKARKELLQKLQTQASINVKIPKEHYRYIIGTKNKTRAELELQTATKIEIPRPEDTSEFVKITGTKEGVEKARHLIQVISDEQAKLAFVRLPIQKCYHPFISGPNGQTVKDLMKRTGIRINIPPMSVMSDEITIAGEKDGVLIAETEIRKIYDNKLRNSKTVSVEVKKSQHKYIIGQRGCNLSEILAETGVWVEVPMSDTSSETITLRGDADKLGIALTAVYAKANSVTQKEMRVAGWLHRFIIGPKGTNIKLMNQEFPKVHIEFCDEENKIVLEGPHDEVESVYAAINEKANDLISKMAYVELKVDPKFHRHIIGKQGSNVARIKKETGVSIRIPPDNSNSDIIRIEGSPEGVSKAKVELIEMVEKMENEKTRDILIDWRFHKAIIGPQGSKIREIRDKFNQVQISFPDSSKQSDVVSLRGLKNEVDKCYKYLQQIAQEVSVSNYQAEVKVFKKFYPTIIGKGGAKIRKIREETDTKIDLPKDDSTSDMITITGKKENVEKAKAMLEAIQSEMSNISEVTVDIPQKLHQSLIGAKGHLIRSIMEECGGVQIRFPGENSTSDKVFIRGPKSDVEKAQKKLLEIASQKIEAGFTAEVHAKSEYHGFLIGKGGAAISKLKEQMGVQFVFANSKDSDPDLITIIGKKEAVEKAKKDLEARIAELANIVELEISVDPKYHRHFTIQRGEVVNQITSECGGITVSFPKPTSKSSRVVLKGAKQCIEAAKSRIEEIIAELEAQVTIEVEVSPKYHGNILGTKGHRIQDLTKEYNVAVKFPERRSEETNGHAENGTNVGEGEKVEKIVNGDSSPSAEKAPSGSSNIILITGKPDNCEAAKQAILELIPVTEEMSIPLEFHGQIIGHKGSFIRQIMEDHEVTLSIPPPSEKLDVIKITGPSKKIDGARKALEDKIHLLEEERADRELKSFKLEVDVPSKYHTQIIGRKGAIITKIRDEHGVNIKFPEKGSEVPDQIIIVGYEENANAAKKDILARVHELESMVTEEVEIDHRIHPRIIGAKGRAVHKIMEEYKVEIRFPGQDAEDKDIVTISGAEDNVLDCKDHLLNVAEEYLQDLEEREEYRSMTKPPSEERSEPFLPKGGNQHSKGFVVRDAPWCQMSASIANSMDEFPNLGAGTAPKPPMSATSWGPGKK